MIKKHRLDNGLTLLTESMRQVRSVSIGVWLRRGSRDEPARLNGISHFIEHLLFKGTARRSARDVAEEIESLGGSVNAFTDKECTCYHARVGEAQASGRWMTDLDRLVSSDVIDWEALLDRIERGGVVLPVRDALTFASQHGLITPPEGFLERAWRVAVMPGERRE